MATTNAVYFCLFLHFYMYNVCFLVIYESRLQIYIIEDVYIFCTLKNVFLYLLYTLNDLLNDMHHCIPIPVTTMDLPYVLFCPIFKEN